MWGIIRPDNSPGEEDDPVEGSREQCRRSAKLEAEPHFDVSRVSQEDISRDE